MSSPELYQDGKRLDIVKQIGKGGEGEVFLLRGSPKRAVKVYTVKDDKGREAKVREMVRLGLADAHNLISFPEQIVTHKSGQFAGFTMKLFENSRQVHELYGVKSRKIYYPKADFRFLVRAAANAARAFGEAHRSDCIIGDVNHSGIMVSSDATVALIDADSFQLTSSQKVYPCVVGVPDFTPPELQGKSLAGVTRTIAHDNFGLAVAIFQLLFMGKHPYNGRYSGADLTLDQFIDRNLFAYTRHRQNGVTPPLGAVTLDDFPQETADAFESAFSLQPSERPSPETWAGVLQSLEGRLSRCSVNSMHFYPTASKGCPWCKMEERSGAILFLSMFMNATVAAVPTNFDVEKAWAAIKALVIPDLQNLKPKMPAFPQAPSEEAKAAKGVIPTNKFWGGGLAVGAIALWVAYPAAAILWLGLLAFSFFKFNQGGIDASPWQSRFREADTRLEEAQNKWRERLGINTAVTLHADLERAVVEYRGLGNAKAAALTKIKAERQNRQLEEFLDRFLITHAQIPGIGAAKTTTLASFGIESAADVKSGAILAIPGFGPATADKLLAWRETHKRKFVYNAAPTPADAQAQAKVQADFAAKASDLAKRIAGGQIELAQIMNSVRQRMSAEDSYLSEVAIHRAQLEVDLRHLGISIPAKTAWATTPKPAVPYPTPAPTGGTGVNTCPRCGSSMVPRVARRGRRSGRPFWGCSRYPVCKGTRN